jgi:hypothetical protein
MLGDLAQDFSGERVIDASLLQKSYIAPHIFKGMAKQPHKAAIKSLHHDTYFMVKGRGSRLTRVSEKEQADKCLIKLAHLESDPSLVDPVVTPPAKPTAWLTAWIKKWKEMFGTPEETASMPKETLSSTPEETLSLSTASMPKETLSSTPEETLSLSTASMPKETPSSEPKDTKQEPKAIAQLVQQAQAIAFQYAGTHVIEAGELCKSGIIPQLFKNLTKTHRKAVEQSLVRDQDYLVARTDKSTGNYVACEPSVNQAKYLVKLQCVIDRLAAASSTSTTTSSQPAGDTRERLPVPVIPFLEELDLEEQELFKDAQGTPYNLTVRGNRHPRCCFFKVADVGRMLGLRDLTTNLCGPTSAYLPEEDYVKMLLEGTGSSPPMDYMGGGRR